jgi:hypothetical protein
VSRNARLGLALVLVAVGAAASGCSVAYVPGDSATTAKPAAATDPLALRRQVQVLANRCTNRKVGGVVVNRSTSSLKVVVEAQMYTPGGAQRNVDVTVSAAAGKTVAWASAPPRGATAASGCQGYAKTIQVVG